MRRLTIFLISTSVLISCSKKPLQVTPLENVQTLDNMGLIYTLPRTVLSIKVESERRVIIPGPYCKFALKYMGIPNVPQQRTDEWRISNIDVIDNLESDPSSLFVVSPGDNVKIDFLKLYNKGLIVPLSNMDVKSTGVVILPKSQNEFPQFVDLSPEPFIGTQKTSFTPKVQQDTGFVRVPIQKDIIVEKSIEDKAKEAADFVFSLRKRRSEFLSVDADHNLNGEGLKVVLDEINRLEFEYLSLFLGKSYSTEFINYFEFIPSDKNGETSIIFRFSGSKGVLNSSDFSGNPVILKLDPEKVPNSYLTFLANITNEKEKPIYDMVYYRIPLSSNLKITDGKIEYLQKRISVCQYGPLVRISARYLIKNNDFIEGK